MVYLTFGLSALLTVFLAIKLSVYADTIERKSALKGVFIALLLGGATSLPEITTSITSVAISNPDLAVGNVLGSNLFNILILASMDLFFRRRQVLDYSNKENTYTSVLAIFLSLVVVASMLIDIPYTVLGVGLDTLLLIVIYFAGMKLISKYADTGEVESSQQVEEGSVDNGPSLKRASIGFGLAAVFIMVFGSLLTISGDKIAVLTGLGSTFVGSFLVAASTSLPEAVSVAIAIRLKNYKLAIGGILGSNLFNLMILAGTDIFYRDGALLSAASGSHLYTILGSLALISISLYGIIRKKSLNAFTYVLPSIFIVVTYFIASYFIFINSGV